MKKVVGLLLAVAFTSSAAFGGTVSFMNPSSGDGSSALVLDPGTSGTFDVWVTDSTNNPFSSLDIVFASAALSLSDWSFSTEFLDAVFSSGVSRPDQIAGIDEEFKVGGAAFSNNMNVPMFIGILTITAPTELGEYNVFVDASQEANGVSKTGAIGASPDPLFGIGTVVVPEPATLALLGLGGIAVLRRRRR